MSSLGSSLTGVRVPTLQARASAASETGAEGSGSAQSNFKPLLFLFTVLLAWVSLAPFKDRGNAAMLDTLVSGSIANRVVYPALLLSLLFSIGLQNRAYLGILMRAGCIPLLAWLVVTTLTSLDPLLSARRVSLFAIHMSIAYMAMLLPRNQNELARLYAIACSIVLILCYVGVALLPHLSIHQLTDVLETDLAGNWRGLFDHKNEAASVMVMFVFVGLFVARVFNPVIGWAISALSAVFLVFTVSKTSIILLPVSLLIAAAVERCRKPSSRALAAVLLLALFNTLTIGASFPGPIRSVLQRTMPDASFTGRTDLWRFAIGSIAERPLVGYGVGAFWRTDATMHRDRETAEPEDISGWAAELGTDSHNGYVDIAVSAGVPGLLLMLYCIVYLPLVDYPNAVKQPENRELARLFLRIWIYVLYLGSLETIIAPQNPAWFMMLQATFGMTLLARYRAR